MVGGGGEGTVQADHAEVSVTTTATDATLTLSGMEHGVFLAVRSSSEETYDITAAGISTPIGPTATTGNLHVVSGVSSGPPNGTLKLMTKKGTLTLQIPESVALPAGLPTATSTNEIVDTYVITKGIGAYKGDMGSGVVEFTFNGVNSFAARYQVGRVAITFTTLIAPPPTTSTS